MLFRILLAASSLLLLATVVLAQTSPSPQPPLPAIPNGRAVPNSIGLYSYDWSGVEISFTFPGDTVGVLYKETDGNYYNIYLNGTLKGFIITTPNELYYPLFTDLGAGNHTVAVVRRTEVIYGSIGLFYGFYNPGDLPDYNGTTVVQPPSVASGPLITQLGSRRIEYLGDSVACAFGALGPNATCQASASTEDISVSYVTQTSQQLNAQQHVECWSGKGVVRNYGDPNTTSPDPFPIYFNRTIAETPSEIWNFTTWIPQAVVIHLGGNDFSTAPSPSNSTFLSGYWSFLQNIFNAYGTSLQAFHLCIPNMDPCELLKSGVSTWNQMHPTLNVTFVNSQNTLQYPQDFGCNGHPNVVGHQKLAKILTPVIASVLKW